MFELMKDPQLTMKQSLMAICDSDTKQFISEGIASLMDWTEATVRCLYP